ncbi:hypothetical protein LCGC14_0115690 [marine sediment metagenome]
MTKMTDVFKPRFFLTTLSVAILATALTGCLDDDDDDDDDDLPENSLVISTQQGDVQGIELEGMRVFRGIPYAAPPVGALRFAATQPAPDRNGTLELNEEFGSACPQGGSTFAVDSVDEDCLFLNVYAPPEPGDYPVMVWIHGGSLVTGSGGSSYEPSRLVEQDIVVVTINYRVGALGFLPHASLTAETGSSGNYGLMDQQEALRWVQENIDGFGGDPDNVTIFGESAGGHSVLSQVASPAAAGLFDKAIVQSGAYSPRQVTLAAGETIFGNSFATNTGCSDDPDIAACLRALPVEDILANQVSSSIPVTGTDTLPISIDEALSTGDFNQVPMVLGNNLDEGRLFVGIQERLAGEVTAGNYQQQVNNLLPASAYDNITVANTYLQRMQDIEGIAPNDPVIYPLALAAIQTDWRFACSNLNQMNQVSDAQVPVWGYWFTDRDAPSILPFTPRFPWGAAHAFEIQYVLANNESLEERGATAAQLDLADAMTGYWANFAKFGDPNSTDGASESVEWDQFNVDETIIDLDPATLRQVPSADFAGFHYCDFWNAGTP